MILAANIIAEEDWSVIVYRNQNVDCAIIIKIADRQSTRRKRLGEHRSALRTHILEVFPGVVKKHERLAIRDLRMQ